MMFDSIEPETWNNILNIFMIIVAPLLGKKGLTIVKGFFEKMTEDIVERLDSLENRFNDTDKAVKKLQSSVNGQVVPALDNITEKVEHP